MRHLSARVGSAALLLWAVVALAGGQVTARPDEKLGVQQSASETAASPAAGSARGLVVRTLIDRSLHSTPVRLLGISRGQVMYAEIDDPPGTLVRRVEVSSLLAIVAAPEDVKLKPGRSPLLVGEPNSPPPVRVVMTDGQVVIGRVVEDATGRENNGAKKGSDLLLEVLALGAGPVTIKLDQIARVETIFDAYLSQPRVAAGVARDLSAGKDDAVVLVNGDLIRGFVESVGAEVVVALKPDEPAARYPLARVERVLIANPVTTASGPCVWLSDGSVIGLSAGAAGAADFFAAGARLGGSLHVKPAEVIGVAFEAQSLVPLSACKAVEYHASSDRSWTRAPRVVQGDAPLGAADIEIPGPMTVEWALPTRAMRLAGTVRLARSTKRWGDCVLVLEDVAPGMPVKRLFNQRLTADAPSASFDVAISPGGRADHRLRLTLESGENGPILDRVVLVRPIVVIDAGQ